MTIDELIDIKLSHLLRQKSDLPEIITVKEAAEVMKCSPQTIYDLAHNAKNNGFPAFKPAKGKILVIKDSLRKWIQEGGLLAFDEE